jgi:hypothetical protein
MVAKKMAATTAMFLGRLGLTGFFFPSQPFDDF